MRCLYRFRNKKRVSKITHKIYKDYAVKKQTYAELKQEYGKSAPTLRKYFDQLQGGTIAGFPFIKKSQNIVLDATFFRRGYGVLVFRGASKNIYWDEITSESIEAVSRALDVLDKICIGGYKSFTIDGRRGIIKLLRERYSEVPIQMCQFHQKQIIRRYVTNNPQTACGRALKCLVADITQIPPHEFITRFKMLQIIFKDFLRERNDKNQFKHRRIRSAFRSLKSNLEYLFTTCYYPELSIPNTTNSCDGSFAHWKAKIKIHRGISKKRRSQMINFLLSQQIYI